MKIIKEQKIMLCVESDFKNSFDKQFLKIDLLCFAKQIFFRNLKYFSPIFYIYKYKSNFYL